MPRREPASRPLARESAGRYATPDGRFSVDHGSGGWMITDREQTDDLGLPLVRGPFASLADAREAIEAARQAPPPQSDLAPRLAASRQAAARGRTTGRQVATTGAQVAETARPARAAVPPAPGPAAADAPAAEPPPIELRAWRRTDGPALRRLWAEAGLGALGDDDESLAAMARRNPGLLLVAVTGDRIVGSALAGWDGRRGWIYHVATASDHRRRGVARRLVAELERRLRALGCPKVNVVVLDSNEDAVTFWSTLGYEMLDARQYGRVLEPSAAGPRSLPAR